MKSLILLSMLSFLLLLTACATTRATIYRHPETEERIVCSTILFDENNEMVYKIIDRTEGEERWVLKDNPDYNKCVEDAKSRGFEDKTAEEIAGGIVENLFFLLIPF